MDGANAVQWIKQKRRRELTPPPGLDSCEGVSKTPIFYDDYAHVAFLCSKGGSKTPEAQAHGARYILNATSTI